MATLLDVSLIGSVKIIFTFLLVYVLFWGLLTWKKPFGESVTVYALISLAIAFFVAGSSTARYMIEFIAPWMVFLAVLLFFILFFLMMFGKTEKDFVKIIGDSTVYTILLIAVGIVIVFAISNAYGQKTLEATQGQTQTYVSPNGEAVIPASTGGGGVFVQANSGEVPVSQPGYVQDLPQPGEPGATNTGDYSLNLINTLLHPKVLAIGVIFLIGTFIVYFLARPQWI